MKKVNILTFIVNFYLTNVKTGVIIQLHQIIFTGKEIVL